jgi:hypothetical protein
VQKTAVALFAVGFVGLLAAGCDPLYPHCDTDENCRQVHANDWCVNNLCVACRDDGDCLAGRECPDGTCRDIPGYCDAEHVCLAGQVCREKRCSPCVSDEECGVFTGCQSGRCVPLPGDCVWTRPRPGEECVNTYYVPIPQPRE